MRKTIERRGASRRMMLWCLAAATTLLGCGIGRGPYPGVPDFVDASSIPVYKGPVAAPQVAYRIDENRYFEVVPYEGAACSRAMLYYVDNAQGIRSSVVEYQRGTMSGSTLVIDAANDQYLVAPMTRGSINCSSGGGFCSGPKLPYSVDGGRTWKRSEPPISGGHDVYLVEDMVYYFGQRANLRELSDGGGDAAWKRYYLTDGRRLPELRRPPQDAKLHCTSNGKE